MMIYYVNFKITKQIFKLSNFMIGDISTSSNHITHYCFVISNCFVNHRQCGRRTCDTNS